MIKPFVQMILSVLISFGVFGYCHFVWSASRELADYDRFSLLVGRYGTIYLLVFALLHLIKAIWSW